MTGSDLPTLSRIHALWLGKHPAIKRLLTVSRGLVVGLWDFGTLVQLQPFDFRVRGGYVSSLCRLGALRSSLRILKSRGKLRKRECNYWADPESRCAVLSCVSVRVVLSPPSVTSPWPDSEATA